MPKDDQPRDIADWLGLSQPLNWAKSRLFGGFVGMILALVLAFLVGAAIWLIVASLKATAISAPGATLGAGGLIVALLGAPFLIWNTVIKQKALGFQKEGHITDRISKAVEQLGAEKKIDRIGRPVTILTGGSTTVTQLVANPDDWEPPKRSRVVRRYQDQTEVRDGEVFDGLHIEVQRWKTKRTVIEWQGEPVIVAGDEWRDAVGAWQVFSESLPNIEVRIGAILSLERIAQDSCAYDRGRDHVRVMEILCAYVRENAPAKNLAPTEPPFPPKLPRLDIQKAIDVVKRRSPAQTSLEANIKYRLDLQAVDFDGADLSKGDFTGAVLQRSRFELAKLDGANFTGAQLAGSLLNYASWYDAKLIGTSLDHCILNRPKPTAGGFNDRSPIMANTNGLSVIASDLSAMDYFGENSEAIFGSKDTILCDNMDELRDKAAGLYRKRQSAEFRNLPEKLAEIDAELGDNPFKRWVPYDSSDMATGHIRATWYASLGLVGWPFSD
jgi:Pentapeptide repeats (8 copies)